LPGWLLHPTTGFSDRRKAALEALESVKGDEPNDCRTAVASIRRNLGLQKICPLPRDASAEFFGWAEAVVDEVLELEEIR
jgi:hypothetical protein